MKINRYNDLYLVKMDIISLLRISSSYMYNKLFAKWTSILWTMNVSLMENNHVSCDIKIH